MANSTPIFTATAQTQPINAANPNVTVLQVPASPVLITMEQMRTMWPAVSEDIQRPILDEFNSNLTAYKLDTPLRKAHFFAQVMIESGPKQQVVESLNYNPAGLMGTFGIYASHPVWAQRDGRTSAHPADQETIANIAYDDANRAPSNRLGNTHIGDGWKYKGRGLKQVTGLWNYTNFTHDYVALWSESIDFVTTPELMQQPKYAVRSAVWYWLHNSLYSIADQGATNQQVNAITAIINSSTNTYGDRRDRFNGYQQGNAHFIGTKYLFNAV